MTRPNYPHWFGYLDDIWREIQIVMFLIMLFRPSFNSYFYFHVFFIIYCEIKLLTSCPGDRIWFSTLPGLSDDKNLCPVGNPSSWLWRSLPSH